MDLFDLYNSNNEKEADFKDNLISAVNYKMHLDKTSFSFEWIEKMEESIRYIDNILRNPNRFIINEEDVVKIELARRITVDSIKHLSKNTNLIQEINEKTEEVKPSKILNINKEESYNTYENRFIYSLIQNMKLYIDVKKRALAGIRADIDNKFLKYQATTKLDKEKYNIEINIDSSLLNNSGEKNSLEDINQRIIKLENKVKDLCSTEVYRNLDRLRIGLITSPIKKTNLILKNTNFIYAVEMWNYLQEHVENDIVNSKEDKEDKIEGRVKNFLDDSFYLNYLILKSQNSITTTDKKEISMNILNNMLERLLDIDVLSQKEIIEIIDKYFSVIKYKTVVNDVEIQNIFKREFDDYVKRFDSILSE